MYKGILDSAENNGVPELYLASLSWLRLVEDGGMLEMVKYEV